jgi:hypothetical protein
MTSTTISNMASKVLWGEGLLLSPQLELLAVAA